MSHISLPGTEDACRLGNGRVPGSNPVCATNWKISMSSYCSLNVNPSQLLSQRYQYGNQITCIEICFESTVLWSGSKYLIYWKWRPGFIWNCKSGNQIFALTRIISCLVFGSSDTHIGLLGTVPGKGINPVVRGECQNCLNDSISDPIGGLKICQESALD